MLNKVISWIFVLIWMFTLFYLSHQHGSDSSELSSEFTEMVVHLFTKMVPFIQLEYSNLTFIVRKLAHLFSYFFLGILVMHAVRVSINKVKRIKGNMYIAFVICLCFAISDEVHQLFIPGRSGEIRDVLIDSIGAFIGIGLYTFCMRIWRK